MKKERKNVFKKIDFLILFAILLVALLFRWYKIDTPLADLHSWRQADTAAVSRNFVRESFNL
ncbi:glycosyl transferase, partial [Candidatus Roizmanbacteria bacterium]|nr:glycosyl transferase [Candidatus Roizmanbacteria bacterium]